jgi:hypothetical protein
VLRERNDADIPARRELSMLKTKWVTGARCSGRARGEEPQLMQVMGRLSIDRDPGSEVIDKVWCYGPGFWLEREEAPLASPLRSVADSESIAAFIPLLEDLIAEGTDEWKIPGLG